MFQRVQHITFQHCDPAGIVFYPRYFEMINETMELWFKEVLNEPFEKLHGPDQKAIPTASMEVTFNAPSKHGEKLIFTLCPEELGNASLKLRFSACCEGEQRLEMTSTIVHIDKTKGTSVPWPAPLREKIRSELAQEENVDA